MVELLLGAALVLSGRGSAVVGVVAAGFFIGIFPGNIAQFVEQTDAFGLDSDAKRFARLWFQPVLVLWALWSTGGWQWLRNRLGRGADGLIAPRGRLERRGDVGVPLPLLLGGRPVPWNAAEGRWLVSDRAEPLRTRPDERTHHGSSPR